MNKTPEHVLLLDIQTDELTPTAETRVDVPLAVQDVVDRPRPKRPALIPRWILFTMLGVVLFAAAVAGLVAYTTYTSRIEAPKLTGVDVGVARTRLAQEGLKLVISTRRFDALPADTVLEQSPTPGTELGRGAAVTVVVSAGTEEFVMPDVIGDGLALARGLLQDKGLEIRIESQPSNQPSDTVLSTNPGPRTPVRTGDIVRVTVASAGPSGTPLLPYAMRGIRVTLDPAPVAGQQVDVPLEVARRLRSLLEASGASVITTRSLIDTGTASQAPARALRAADGSSTATVALGIGTNPAGVGGLTVATPKSGSAPVVATSTRLASEIASALAAGSGVKTPKRSQVATDTVLGRTNAPWARVTLGSFGSADDVARFRDPAWADTIARALYRAIARLYGQKATSP